MASLLYGKLKTYRFLALLFLLFVAFSIVFISPETRKPRSRIHSSELEKVEYTIDNISRIDYFDENGHLATAADLGYASKQIIKEGNCAIEEYYDEFGKIINTNSGYYYIIREYDEKGNNNRCTYLGIDKEPVIISEGYAIEDKTINDIGQVISVKYFGIDGAPVLTDYYGYGKVNEYDAKGRLKRITYIDQFNNPMVTMLGYSSVCRTFDSNTDDKKNKIVNEFYYDATGNPISLSLGQFGVRKRYNLMGQEVTLTYLDKDGNPIITTKGYTTIERTYYANNTIATEKYYNIRGEPISLVEGQYGIKYENGRTIYIDKNDKEIINIKNLLYNKSPFIVLFAIMIILVSAMLDAMKNILVLVLYIGIILYFTLMYRDDINSKIGIGFFNSYKEFFFDSTERADILKNIWLFIPLGAILYKLHPNINIIIISVALSVLIEGIQFAFKIGFCELDDIVSNSMGGWMGFHIGRMTSIILLRINFWKHIHSLKRR